MNESGGKYGFEFLEGGEISDSDGSKIIRAGKHGIACVSLNSQKICSIVCGNEKREINFKGPFAKLFDANEEKITLYTKDGQELVIE